MIKSIRSQSTWLILVQEICNLNSTLTPTDTHTSILKSGDNFDLIEMVKLSLMVFFSNNILSPRLSHLLMTFGFIRFLFVNRSRSIYQYRSLHPFSLIQIFLAQKIHNRLNDPFFPPNTSKFCLFHYFIAEFNPFFGCLNKFIIT